MVKKASTILLASILLLLASCTPDKAANATSTPNPLPDINISDNTGAELLDSTSHNPTDKEEYKPPIVDIPNDRDNVNVSDEQENIEIKPDESVIETPEIVIETKIDKSTLPLEEVLIGYYDYGNFYYKLYSMIPNLIISETTDGDITISYNYKNTISEYDAKIIMDALITKILNISNEYFIQTMAGDIVCSMSIDTYSNAKEQYLNNYTKSLEDAIIKNNFSSVVISDDLSEVEFNRSDNTEITNEDLNLLKVRLATYVNLAKLLMNNEDEPIKLYNNQNGKSVNQVEFRVAQVIDYENLWLGWDCIGRENFGAAAISNMSFEDTGKDIKVVMPTNMFVDYDLNVYYISLCNDLFKSSSSMYFEQDYICCYISYEEFQNIKTDIQYRLDNFVANHKNIKELKSGSKVDKFFVNSNTVDQTLRDYYEYALLNIANSQFSAEGKLDERSRQMAVYGADGALLVYGDYSEPEFNLEFEIISWDKTTISNESRIEITQFLEFMYSIADTGYNYSISFEHSIPTAEYINDTQSILRILGNVTIDKLLDSENVQISIDKAESYNYADIWNTINLIKYVDDLDVNIDESSVYMTMSYQDLIDSMRYYTGCLGTLETELRNHEIDFDFSNPEIVGEIESTLITEYMKCRCIVDTLSVINNQQES